MQQAVTQHDLTQYEMSSIDKPPQVIKAFPPNYPYEARKDKLSGTVVARFIVTKKGKPVNFSIVKSDLPSIFDEPVINAIKKYEFSPALKNGIPVDCIVKLPIAMICH